MGIEAAELAAQRLLTKAFIQADYLLVPLTRHVMMPDGAGGTEDVEVVLPEQTMRLLPLGDGAEERLTADGRAVRPSYMLQGMHDADMERWDTFTLDGHRYEVVFVNENRQYQVKGEVYYRG